MIRTIIVFSLMVLCNKLFAQLEHYSWPTGVGEAIVSDKYRIYVKEGSGQEEEVIVLMSNATGDGDWQWEDLEGRTFSFVNLSYNYTGANELTIRLEKIFGGNADDIKVYPSRYGIAPSATSGTETSIVTTGNQQYLSVHFEAADNTSGINGWIEHMLCIFIDPIESAFPDGNVVNYADDVAVVDLTNAETIYFGAGYHNLNDYTNGGEGLIIDADGVLELQNGQHIYIEGGAFVEGIIDFPNNDDEFHKIYGRGILTGRQYLWKSDPNHTDDDREYEELINVGHDAIIDGITYMESPSHGIVGKSGVTIQNVKYLGWHGNNDGVRISSGGHVSHSFFRAVDDHFYNFDNYIHDCVLWAGHNGAVLTYGWGGVEGSNTYNSGSTLMENIDIIHPEWVNLGNNNGIVASQVGLDYAPHEYNDSTTTILRNFVIEGAIPGIVNLKPRTASLDNIAIEVTEATLGYLGDLLLEDFEIESIIDTEPGLIRGELDATSDGTSPWLVKSVTFKDVNINGTCLSADNVGDFITIEEATSEEIFFECVLVDDIEDLLATTFSCDSVVLTWSDLLSEDGYRVQRKLAGESDFSDLVNLGSGITSYTDNTIAENTNYHYRVLPLIADVAEATSNTENVAIGTCTIADLSASSTECDQTILNWSDVDNEDGYRISRRLATESEYTTIGELNANEETYKDNSIMENATYHYQVSTLVDGVVSTISNEASATTPICPIGLDLIAYADTCDHVLLSWKDIDGENRYRISKSTDSVVFSIIADVDADDTTHVDEVVSEASTYYYVISALDDSSVAILISDTVEVNVPICDDNDGDVLSVNPMPEIIFYPNPVSDVLFFTELSNGTRINIIDLTGQVIAHEPIVQGRINISKLPAGTYLIDLSGKSLGKFTKK